MKRFHSLKTGLLVVSAAVVLAGCATSGHRYSEANDGYPSDAPDLSNIPDAVPRKEPLAASGNSPTYEVLGNVYHVLPSANGYDREGVASFYGTKFNGYHTSDGEVYNMYAMSAASKVLPLPTYAKVTNLENGRSVIVRVNDRGPFNSRIMDLSYAAAYKLGYLQKGTARVRVQAINPDTWHPSAAVDNSQPTTNETQNSSEQLSSDSAGELMASTSGASPQNPSGSTPAVSGAYLQAIAVTDEGQAEQIRQRLSGSLGVPGRIVPFRNYFRVQMGPFGSDSAINQARSELNSLGYPGAILIR